MSPRDDRLLLADMLEHAILARDAAAGRTRKDLDTDRTFRAALERFMEIIGEAAHRVSERQQAQMPEFPWADIVGMRNRLVHGYAEISFDILWRVVHDDLPRLIESLEQHLGE